MLQNLRAIKPERLSAIEIAEGALLADIGVVFQLLATYLPVGGEYLRLLIPIPFAILVLRRRLYAGIMGFCVALFIVGVLTGPTHVVLMAAEAGAGVFLGVTMKYRMQHLLLLLLGVTSSSIGAYGFIVFAQLLTGLPPLAETILFFQQTYLGLLFILGFIASQLGAGNWWTHSAYPVLAPLAQLIFTYWWEIFYVAIWLILWPVVIIVYLVTNFFVRLLGYDVNPFPGGILEKLLHWILRLIIRLALSLGLGKHWLTRTLVKEVRRQGMQRHLQSPIAPDTFLEVPVSGGRSIAVRARAARFRGYSKDPDQGDDACLNPSPASPPDGTHRRGCEGIDTRSASFAEGPYRRFARLHKKCLGERQSPTAPLAPTRDATTGRLTSIGQASPLVDMQHITYTYPYQSTPALQDISLQVQQGEYVVILGHNGSGKSTLARHCNALLTPISGRMLVAGLDTSDKAKLRLIRETVGMIFQNPDNQIIATVVEDDVAWALTVRGLPAALIRERVADAMAAVGIANMGKLPPHQLSGGQRQRLAIAGVLALRPQCIIADEATAQLDPLSRREIVAVLHQLHEEYGLTIIQVTHFLEEAALAQRVVVMEQGEIVMEGPPATIFADVERLRRLKLAIPEPIELAARLRNAGLAIPQEALTVATIAQELVR